MKIFSVVYICFFILVAISIISGLALNQVQQQVGLVTEYHEKMSVPSISVLHQISAQYEKMFRLIKEQVITPTDKTEFNLTLQQLRSSISQYTELTIKINSREEFLAPPEMRDMMQNFVNDMNNIVDSSDTTNNEIALLLENKNSNDEQVAILFEDLEMNYENIFGIVGVALEMETLEKINQQEQVEKYYVDSNFIVLAMVVFMSSTLTIIVTLLKPPITKNIEILKKSTKKIAKGDFKTRISLTGSKDEIFDLAVDVNKMAEELEKNQRKKIQEAQRKKTNEVLYEIIPDCVITFDKNNKFLDCNKKFLDALGFSKDEIIGKHVTDLIGEEDQELASDVIQRLSEGETIMEINLHPKRKDGSIFHSIWSAIPILDDNEEYMGSVSIGIDLTEIDKLRDELVKKEKMSASLKLKEAQMKKTEKVLFETIPNPVVTFDQNSKLVDCNQYFLDVMGFSKDEILGKYAPNFLTEEDKNAFGEILSTLKEGKEPMEVDLHIKKRDGSIFHSLWSHIAIYDNNNEYLGFTGIGLDLTEIDRLRDELVKKEKISTVGQLATNLAHDIKNPLASMKQSLEIIQRRAKEDEISKKESERANRVIKRIEHQVDQVLNYVKTTPLQATHTTVLTILKQSLDLLAIPNNISIEIPEEDFGVIWDETQISVVFTNIILNAIQAIEKNTGKISIRAAQENDSIKIEIEDTGPNIPEKDLDKIFEPLFTTKMEGTGLGLAGCKNIIQSHKGTFTVTNNPVKFTIKIPKNLDGFN